jgi:nitric oxide dioxygenase
VGQLLRQLDSRLDLADCVADAGACPLITECRLRAALSRAREAFYRELDDVVVACLPASSQMSPAFRAIGLRPASARGFRPWSQCAYVEPERHPRASRFVDSARPGPRPRATISGVNMLSDKSFPVIEATRPLVGSRIGDITPKFYARLFAARPELLDGLFSRSNQRNGHQQQALAGSIAAFASHPVSNPGTLPETVLSRIAHRHASLGITEPQYQVVYEHLFAAIAEDLAEIKTPAGTGSMTSTLEPTDHTPITPALPHSRTPALPHSRASMSASRSRSRTACARSASTRSPALPAPAAPSPPSWTTAVRSPPCCTAPWRSATSWRSRTPTARSPSKTATAPWCCLGRHRLHPTASILRSLAESGSDRQVLVLHAESSLESWAPRGQMTDDVERLEGADLQLWLEQPEAGAKAGLMSLREVDLPANASLNLCGPLPFMKNIRNEAINAGIPATKIHYEVFGPDIWLAS